MDILTLRLKDLAYAIDNRIDGVETRIFNLESAAPSGGGAATWGSITGTLALQADLAAALAAKADDAAVTAALAGKEPTIAAGTGGQYWRGDKAWAALDKAAVGLANVDNTSDADKPVSTATQAALDAKLSGTYPGGTVAFLRADGTWAAPPGGGGAAWGGITGTLGDQTDLQAALDAKQPVGTYATGGGTATGTNTGDQTTITGNAGSATVLQTGRTINGTSFNGSANITTANWGTSRTLTIGGTGKSVNGSAAVSWSLAEIGAQAAHANLTSLAGLTLSGNAGLVVKVNAGATGFELAADATGGGGVSDGDKGDIVVSGSGATWAFDSGVVTAFARDLLDDADATAARSTLGLGTLATQNGTFSGTSAGTNTGDQFTAMTTSRLLGRVTAGFGAAEELTAAQVKTLLAITASDVSSLGYFATGTDAANLTGTLAAARIADASLSIAKTSGLQAALDAKQASDSELTALAGLTSAADRLPYFTGSGTAALATFTAFGRSLADDADAAAGRATLGVSATGADTAYAFRANNLSDLASATTARTNLGLGTAATRNIHVGTTAPGSPATNDLWVDTT